MSSATQSLHSQTQPDAAPQVALYPSYAAPLPDGDGWLMQIHGCVYEPGVVTFRKRLMLRLLRRVMRVDATALESETFRDRIAGFVASPERGRRITIHVGATSFPLRKRSNSNGQFRAAIRLTENQLRSALEHQEIEEGSWLPIGIQVHPHSGQTLGRVQLLGQTGWSVVSDIDDTIKHTNVACRRSMLANTFLNAFQSVDGMADRYNSWRQQGVAFHYVSSSPWQLFQPLHDHCQSEGFPDGSIHLRSFRLRDHMLRRLLLLRRSGKAVTIREILEAFPWREFVLVGDSGEKDPEIYARLAQQYPQVKGVLIRDLSARPMSESRRAKVFRGIAPNRWSLYEAAEDLPFELDEHFGSLAPVSAK